MNEQNPLKSLVERLREPAFALTILGALTFVVYAGTLSFDFVWDDFAQIVDNPLIRSWRSLPNVFRSDLWFNGVRDQTYYRPFFITWEILNYAFFSLKPWGWHLVTILLHVGASFSVYWLARKLKLEYWTAIIAALIFAIHPVHIEVAAWIAAGSDSMVTILYIASFAAFVNSVEKDAKKWVWKSLSLVLLVCACLTKEMGVTLCAIVALYTWLNGSETASKLKRGWSSFVAALPYALATVGYLILRHFAVARGVRVDTAHNFWDMLVTLPLVLVTYLRILVFPAGLNAFYYTRYVEGAFHSWNFYLPVIVLAGLVCLLGFWAHRKHDKTVTFAGLWLIVTLAPVLYLRGFAAGDFVRDRYAYLPSVGFAILLAKAIRLLPGLNDRFQASASQIAAVSALSLLFLAGCVTQQTYWANDLLVSYRGYRLSPESDYGAINFVGALMKRHDYARALPLIDERIAKYPNRTSSNHLLYSLAVIYFDSGRIEEGRATLQRALAAMPEFVETDSGAAQFVGLLGRAKDYDGALRLCSKLLPKQQDRFTVVYNCAVANFEAGQNAKAEELFQRVEQVAPDRSASKYFLGRIALQRGRNSDAESYLRSAIAIDATGAEYHYWLGQTLESAGRLDDAKREYASELNYNPRYAPAQKRLLELQGKN